jgi:tetratricopeptide (TPR) repeat protein
MTYNALGVLYDLQGKMDESDAIYIRGIEVARAAELSSQYATLLIKGAILQRLSGDLNHSRQLIGQALSNYRNSKIPPTGSVCIALANSLFT